MMRQAMAAWALAGLVVASGAGGYLIGEAHATQATWHTARAYVGDHVVSLRVGDWTYGFRDSVPQWIDRSGSVHDSGWPDCVRVPAGTQKVIRFAEVGIEVGALGTRQVVMVDCRES
ncbi:hypothetical protein [Oryzihumus sp.]|uniref:hypothetical protein n=1 Tax=Oryzihumus sp. TaxID=1968903 RepID=UPI002EDA9459